MCMYFSQPRVFVVCFNYDNHILNCGIRHYDKYMGIGPRGQGELFGVDGTLLLISLPPTSKFLLVTCICAYDFVT